MPPLQGIGSISVAQRPSKAATASKSTHSFLQECTDCQVGDLRNLPRAREALLWGVGLSVKFRMVQVSQFLYCRWKCIDPPGAATIWGIRRLLEGCNTGNYANCKQLFFRFCIFKVFVHGSLPSLLAHAPWHVCVFFRHAAFAAKGKLLGNLHQQGAAAESFPNGSNIKCPKISRHQIASSRKFAPAAFVAWEALRPAA